LVPDITLKIKDPKITFTVPKSDVTHKIKKKHIIVKLTVIDPLMNLRYLIKNEVNKYLKIKVTKNVLFTF